jgi:cyclase
VLKVRIIPILTFNGFGLVKTKKFTSPRMVGNAVQAARVYNSRGVDELVFLDIFASSQSRKFNLKLVADVIRECYMPVAIGGGIQSLEDINQLLRIGADKVVIKTKALTDPNFIREAVRFFGSQCISISVDVIKRNGSYYIHNRLGIDISLLEFLRNMEECEVGEIVLNNVDNDGMMQGFDIELVSKVLDSCKIPVIAVGGGGEPRHFADLFCNTRIQAVGAASIFHFTQYTPKDIKLELAQHGISVRI